MADENNAPSDSGTRLQGAAETIRKIREAVNNGAKNIDMATLERAEQALKDANGITDPVALEAAVQRVEQERNALQGNGDEQDAKRKNEEEAAKTQQNVMGIFAGIGVAASGVIQNVGNHMIGNVLLPNGIPNEGQAPGGPDLP